MVQTMSSPADYRTTPRAQATDDTSSFLARWLKVWVALLTVVTLVVVVYLIAITNSLSDINGNLATADEAVQGAGADVVTLPDQVDRINGALEGIDPALKPIPGQADQIIGALGSINGKLTSTDSSLKDTSGMLTTTLNNARSISGLLIDADDPPDRLGVQNIHHRVAGINGQRSRAVGAVPDAGGCGPACQPNNLTTAEQDAANILGQLVSVNSHLRSTCHALATGPAGLLGGVTGVGPC